MSLIPKIRGDLIYAPDPEREGYWYIKDPIRGEYLSFNEVQVAMMKALDGVRTPDAIQELLGEEFGVDIPTDKIESFTKRLEREYLLDLSSYKVDDEKTRRAILRILKKRGLVFRVTPRDAGQPEGQLFSQGMAHLLRGNPSEGAGYFSAVLEINPNNARAQQVLAAIHEGFLETKRYEASYKLLIPLWKPDRFLKRLDRVIGRFLFSWLGFATVVAIALLMFVPMVDVLSRNTVFTRSTDGIDIVVALAMTFFFLMFHEAMHGLACTHYGGTVADIGLMLFYYMFPGAWCDTSDVFVIASRKHKAIVFLAGVGFEIIPLAVLWWLLYLADPNVPGWNGLVALASLITFSNYQNLNPLVQLDGYFTLAALVGQMNLRSEAFAYAKRSLVATLFGVKSDAPEPTPRERRIYLWYGALSALYTPLWTILEVVVFLPWLVDNMGRIGWFIAAFMLFNLIWGRMFRAVFRFVKFLVKERRSVFTRRRSLAFVIVIGGLVAILAAPCAFPIDGEMTIEPKQQASARISEPGIVETVLVEEGTHVKAGQPVAILRSMALDRLRYAADEQLTIAKMRLERLEAGASTQEVDLAIARSHAGHVASGVEAQRLADQRRFHDLEISSSRDLAAASGTAARADGARAIADAETAIVKAGARREEIEAARATVHHWETEVTQVGQRIEHLRVTSPIDGVVVGKRLRDRVGARLAQGDEFLKVIDDSGWRARIVPFRGEVLGDVREGQTIELHAFADPDDVIEVKVERVVPPRGDDDAPSIETSTFVNPAWRGGMTGRARIFGPRCTVAYRFFVVPVARIIDYEFWRYL